MNHHRSTLGLILVACLVILPGLFGGESTLEACTIAVVSGKATEDGRPLLWKNRDTDARGNMLQFFSGGKYRLLAVIDAGKTEAIWMGMNEAGFCLANSLSLGLPVGHKTGRGNGRFMKQALETCASVEDFEKLLLETNESGRRTRANFGVIDAHGAAMLFEAGHRSFVKYDANDPKMAPQGYLVRSNFSMSVKGIGQLERREEFLKVYSGDRFLRADGLVGNYLSQNGRLDYRFFLQSLSRDIASTLDDPPNSIRFRCSASSGKEAKTERVSLLESINTQSTINRRNTVSAVVFHGVKPGTSPQWTTMWTLLGQPAFSVAVPCWMTESPPPAMLCGKMKSPLCTAASQLQKWNYTSPTLLSTRWLPRVWSETLPCENQIIAQTTERMTRWRKNKKFPTAEEIAGFQEAMAESALQSLLKVQALISTQPALAEKPIRSQLVSVKTKVSRTANIIGE